MKKKANFKIEKHRETWIQIEDTKEREREREREREIHLWYPSLIYNENLYNINIII